MKKYSGTTFFFLFISTVPLCICLHSIFVILQFEISSLMNWIFSLFQTWILQATAGRNIKFKEEKNQGVSQLDFYFQI